MFLLLLTIGICPDLHAWERMILGSYRWIQQAAHSRVWRADAVRRAECREPMIKTKVWARAILLTIRGIPSL